jgi:hypothetical protein
MKYNKWLRSGTIVSPDGTEIDLCDNKNNWITVKGRTDRSCELLAKKLLTLLNSKK